MNQSFRRILVSPLPWLVGATLTYVFQQSLQTEFALPFVMPVMGGLLFQACAMIAYMTRVAGGGGFLMMPIHNQDIVGPAGLMQSMSDLLATFKKDDHATTHQIAMSTLRLVIDDLRRHLVAVDHHRHIKLFAASVGDEQFRKVLLDSKPGKVVATCFTEMDSFWCNSRIGPDYLDLNHTLKENGATIERVFWVRDNDRWMDLEPKKRELVRILEGLEMTCLTTDQSQQADIFLLLDASGHPILGAEWELGSQGDPAYIKVFFGRSAIGLFDKYNTMRRSARRVDFSQSVYKPYDEDLAHAKERLRYLSPEKLGRNSLRYLDIEEPHPRSVAEYWKGLEGGIVRPSKDTQEFVTDSWSKIVKHYSDRMPAAPASTREPRGSGSAGVDALALNTPAACVLGCTPEVRTILWQEEAKKRILVMDIVQYMYEAMSRVCSESEVPSSESFVPTNWLSFRAESEFDLLVGVDSLNMLCRDEWRAFIKRIATGLRPGGIAIFQIVYPPVTSSHSQGPLESQLRDLAASNDPLCVHRAILEVAEHDMRVRCARGRWDALDLEAARLRVDQFGRDVGDEAIRSFCLRVSHVYKHCLSTLHLVAPDELQDMARAAGLKPHGAPNSKSGTGPIDRYMHVFRFHKPPDILRSTA